MNFPNSCFIECSYSTGHIYELSPTNRWNDGLSKKLSPCFTKLYGVEKNVTIKIPFWDTPSILKYIIGVFLPTTSFFFKEHHFVIGIRLESSLMGVSKTFWLPFYLSEG